MSGWEAWVQKVCQTSDGTVAATKAGIFDTAGNPWHVTPGNFVIPAAFFRNVDAVMSKGTGAHTATKLEIPGLPTFMILRADDKTVIAKGKNAGVTVSRAKSCFVVGLYDHESVSPANNTKQTEQVRLELETAGF